MPSLSVIWYVYSQCKTELVMDRLQLTRSLPGSHKHRDNYYPMLSQLLDSQTNHRCSDINLEHFLTCRCFELLLCQASGFFCKAAGWCVSVVTSVDWLTGWFVGCYTNWFIIGVMRTLFGIPIYQPGSVFVGGFPESSPRRPNDFFQFSHLVCDQLSRTQTFLKISLFFKSWQKISLYQTSTLITTFRYTLPHCRPLRRCFAVDHLTQRCLLAFNCHPPS